MLARCMALKILVANVLGKVSGCCVISDLRTTAPHLMRNLEETMQGLVL